MVLPHNNSKGDGLIGLGIGELDEDTSSGWVILITSWAVFHLRYVLNGP